MLVHLTRKLYDEFVSYSTNSLPNEACGIILGEAYPARDELHALSFVPLRNRAVSPLHHFVIDPIELLPYLTNTVHKHPLIGLFHSHPTAAPIPSAEDLQTEWHTLPSYWILSLQHTANPDLQVYQLKKTTTTAYHKLSFVIGQ